MRRHSIFKAVVPTIIVGLFALLIPSSVYAHVSVSPAEALPGSYEVFTTNVPNEKEVPVTGIRLVIPKGVESVTPTVKQGWIITLKKVGNSVTEITWTGGIIDADLRDEFTFSAKVPASEKEVVWKAYQTYQDGTIVAWDQKPTDEHAHAAEKNEGPYSVTNIVEADENSVDEYNPSNVIAYALSGAALVIAIIALGRAIK